MKIGLKVWSTNSNYILDAKRLYELGYYDYIELYTVPDSYNEFASYWDRLDIPVNIHGPHIKSGFNLSLRDRRERNMEMVDEVKRFADHFRSDYIIFHPGLCGTEDELINQLKIINDNRVLIENMPYRAIDGISQCLGYTSDKIQKIIEETNVAFCLDIGHATCASNSIGIDNISMIKSLLELKPRVVHFMDGDVNSEVDMHLNLGRGSFQLAAIIALLKGIPFLALETEKKENHNLSDFMEDTVILRQLMKNNA